MSPTGAYGMNTGIGDAVDLSWKLAAAVEGWGGDILLDSFDAERRPIAHRNVTEASSNLRRMLSPGRNDELLDDTEAGAAMRHRVGTAMTEAMRHEWFTLGMHLGYRYENSPVCVADGTPPTPDDPQKLHSDHAARQPGAACLAGERPLDSRSVRSNFCADAHRNARAGYQRARRGGAADGGMPLEVVSIDEPAVTAAYERRLVLVRPDGHVAWRGDETRRSAQRSSAPFVAPVRRPASTDVGARLGTSGTRLTGSVVPHEMRG